MTAEQKASNRKISSARIAIEHINAKLKVFKILAISYGNRPKRFSLRTTIIAAIINLSLGFERGYRPSAGIPPQKKTNKVSFLVLFKF